MPSWRLGTRASAATTGKAPAEVARTLTAWKAESDLAGVRDPDALARLPEAERKDWQALWADVEELLVRASRGDPAKP